MSERELENDGKIALLILELSKIRVYDLVMRARKVILDMQTLEKYKQGE